MQSPIIGSVFIPSVHRSVDMKQLSTILEKHGVIERVDFVEMEHFKKNWRRAFVHFKDFKTDAFHEGEELYYTVNISGYICDYKMITLVNRTPIPITNLNIHQLAYQLYELQQEMVKKDEIIQELQDRLSRLESNNIVLDDVDVIEMPSPPPLVRQTNNPFSNDMWTEFGGKNDIFSFESPMCKRQETHYPHPEDVIDVYNIINTSTEKEFWWPEFELDDLLPPPFLKRQNTLGSGLPEPAHVPVEEEPAHVPVQEEPVQEEPVEEIVQEYCETRMPPTTCTGCYPEYQPNQLAHMECGGCLAFTVRYGEEIQFSS